MNYAKHEKVSLGNKTKQKSMFPGVFFGKICLLQTSINMPKKLLINSADNYCRFPINSV